MAGILFPDIAGALSSGAQAGAASAQNQFLMKDRAARDEIAPLIPRALQGDREALNQIGTRHPDTLMKIAPLLDRADAATRTRAKEAADWTTKAAMGVLSLPPEERPAAYQAALADGQRLGYQIDMPPQYDRAVEGRLNQVINQARPIADYFKGRDEGFDLVPSGGGGGAALPAAGASGDVLSRTKQAIGGMESGNRYGAVGPDTGGGKKAYGKYQVMDFNVGPWTQEALGRALTPEQFLASPQAQEAVADFKLGQYINQFGSPEAAARAWFAGAGGMNNASAKDVLGTSVQGYGQKFAQAFGPGATGGAQPPGIAQGDTALPADASGNPISTSDGGSVPREAMRLITPNLPPGTSLGRDRKTGLFKVQEGNFVVYDSNRNPVGLIPVPKTPGAGPFTGTGVEAQALNMLIANNTLTPQQAAELAAGKSVTDPATGQIIFKTPSGIFGLNPGQGPQPLIGQQGGAPLQAAGGPAGVPAPAAPAAPAVTVPANPGSFPLTSPKTPDAVKKFTAEALAVNSAIDNFNAILSEAGGGTLGAFMNNPRDPQAQKINGAFNALKTALRSEAFINTGVLQPAEMTMLDNMLLAPTSVRGLVATPEAYAEMLNQIKQFVNGKMASVQTAYGQPATGLPGAPATQPAQQSAPPPPAVGTVIDGYLFKGGNPADQNNWSKAP